MNSRYRDPDGLGMIPMDEAMSQWTDRSGLGAILRSGLFDSDRWAEMVGKDIAMSGRPVRLTSGILAVEAVDEIGAVRLEYSSDAIRQVVNESAGTDIVDSVRVERGW